MLAIGREGYDIAAWLNSIGVSAFVLKYRVPARSWLPFGGAPLMDAQRAMGLVRQMAASGKVPGLNASKIGFMGFSAGAWRHYGAVDRGGAAAAAAALAAALNHAVPRRQHALLMLFGRVPFSVFICGCPFPVCRAKKVRGQRVPFTHGAGVALARPTGVRTDPPPPPPPFSLSLCMCVWVCVCVCVSPVFACVRVHGQVVI